MDNYFFHSRSERATSECRNNMADSSIGSGGAIDKLQCSEDSSFEELEEDIVSFMHICKSERNIEIVVKITRITVLFIYVETYFKIP